METIAMPTSIKVNVHSIPFEEVPQFSKRDTAYVNELDALRPFYKYDVRLEAFQQVIEDKSKQPIDRTLLIDVLTKQYAAFSKSSKVDLQIQRLADSNTYTIITAHQPSLFTGPLYYIYKIISTIELTKTLNTEYSDYHFVPVFITGGEDHDFEEMNHAQIFNNRLEWQNDEKGSVGMMKTASLKPVLEELKGILGNSEKAAEIYELIESTHTNFDQYSEATMALAHELFKEDGLVILNMNQKELKRAFIPILKQELFEQVSHNFIEKTQVQLETAGFKAQAFPRQINLFYLTDQVRERIVFEDDMFKVLNTNYSFTKSEMESELEAHPERFSPNVNTRPLYQEFIVPNLAYVGGGGELAYWMERQSQFEHFKINFPMLIRRNSVLWIDKNIKKKMNKLGLTVYDFLKKEHKIINEFVDETADSTLNLDAQKQQIETIFKEISSIAIEVDPTLKKTVLAEQTRQLKAIEQIESRLVRAEKQKHEVALNQIKSIKEKLFPNRGLQERVDNFIPFFLKYGWEYFEILKLHLNPLEKELVVIEEE